VGLGTEGLKRRMLRLLTLLCASARIWAARRRKVDCVRKLPAERRYVPSSESRSSAQSLSAKLLPGRTDEVKRRTRNRSVPP
jgi:hypothetical protein